jgi:hypothetical protein
MLKNKNVTFCYKVLIAFNKAGFIFVMCYLKLQITPNTLHPDSPKRGIFFMHPFLLNA